MTLPWLILTLIYLSLGFLCYTGIKYNEPESVEEAPILVIIMSFTIGPFFAIIGLIEMIIKGEKNDE